MCSIFGRVNMVKRWCEAQRAHQMVDKNIISTRPSNTLKRTENKDSLFATKWGTNLSFSIPIYRIYVMQHVSHFYAFQSMNWNKCTLERIIFGQNQIFELTIARKLPLSSFGWLQLIFVKQYNATVHKLHSISILLDLNKRKPKNEYHNLRCLHWLCKTEKFAHVFSLFLNKIHNFSDILHNHWTKFNK